MRLETRNDLLAVSLPVRINRRIVTLFEFFLFFIFLWGQNGDIIEEGGDVRPREALPGCGKFTSELFVKEPFPILVVIDSGADVADKDVRERQLESADALKPQFKVSAGDISEEDVRMVFNKGVELPNFFFSFLAGV